MNQPQVYMCPPARTPCHLRPHPIPLDHPSALALSALFHALNLDWSPTSHMVIHIFNAILSAVLFIRTLIPLMKLLSSWPNHLSNQIILKSSHWGLDVNKQIVEGDKHPIYSCNQNTKSHLKLTFPSASASLRSPCWHRWYEPYVLFSPPNTPLLSLLPLPSTPAS